MTSKERAAAWLKSNGLANRTDWAHARDRESLAALIDDVRAEERAAVRRWLIIQSGDYAPICAAIRDGAHLNGSI